MIRAILARFAPEARHDDARMRRLAERALDAKLAAAKAERIAKNPPRRTFKRRVML